MTKVYFTKKHIIVASVIGVAIVSLLLSFWFMVISPKRKQVIEAKEQLISLKQESQTVNQKLEQLRAKPNLLDSDAVKQLPTIPNGVSLEDYFKQLSQLEQDLSLSLLAFNFNDKVLFPGQNTQTTDQSTTATEPAAIDKQLRATDIGIEILSDKKENLLQFVGRLEKLERFLTIQSVEYRSRQGEGGSETASCSASLVVRLYYLSDHETGKALKAE